MPDLMLRIDAGWYRSAIEALDSGDCMDMIEPLAEIVQEAEKQNPELVWNDVEHDLSGI